MCTVIILAENVNLVYKCKASSSSYSMSLRSSYIYSKWEAIQRFFLRQKNISLLHFPCGADPQKGWKGI